ncbi:hypothetical protein MBLNU13_g08909t2 [Cladosporium sp. NU13]
MEVVALLQARRDELWKVREERSGMIAKIQARMENEKEIVGKKAPYMYEEGGERRMCVREKRRAKIAKLRGEMSEMDVRQERLEEPIEWALEEMAKGRSEMAVTMRGGREELETAVMVAKQRIAREKEMLEALIVKLGIECEDQDEDKDGKNERPDIKDSKYEKVNIKEA